MKKRHTEEEHENEERWLLTYADLITLLMAFFMVMYSLSRVDTAKFKVMAESLANVFPVSNASYVPLPGVGGQKGKEPTSAMRKPPGSVPGKNKEKKPMEKLAEQFQQLVQAEGLAGSVTVSPSPNGRKLMVRLSESLLISPGSANLEAESAPLIDKISELIATTNKPVCVEGHTDNIPINNAQFHSNWELSTARAASVIRYIIDKHGFSPELLSASGYGEFRPVAPNDTPENRAKNRRVEFVITDKEEEN